MTRYLFPLAYDVTALINNLVPVSFHKIAKTSRVLGSSYYGRHPWSTTTAKRFDSEGVEQNDAVLAKPIWLSQHGLYGQYQIDAISYQDKPLDLSNLLFVRTRERMLLEARAVDPSQQANSVVPKGQVLQYLKTLGDNALVRRTLSLREAYDEDVSALVRLLNVVRDHESEYDFPVAFFTNTMYVVSKNNLNGLINWDAFNSLILQKISYIHLEGIS